jgi:hypothetical protein
MKQETLTRVFEWPVAVATLPEGSPQVVPLRVAEKGNTVTDNEQESLP